MTAEPPQTTRLAHPPRPLTVLFAPESAYGPTNQCIGLGSILCSRGHRVAFAAESSWRGRLRPYGFEEHLLDLAPSAEDGENEDAGAFWADFIETTAPEFRKPTILQIDTFIKPTWQALIDGAKYAEPRLRQILAAVKPDVIVQDNVVAFPALVTDDAPYVRIVSCNPLEIRGQGIPPVFSGLPAADPSGWRAFRDEYDRTHRPMWSAFDAWVQEQGAPALPDLEFIHTSADANLWLYPADADYTDARPLGAGWHPIDSSVRETDEPYALPSEVAERRPGEALVYLSLGSLASADIGLMQRLIDLLGKTRHRFIVSLGPRGDQLRLPDGMVGAAMLPQTSIMPLVDVVITHGGNNTVTEALHFGRPMIVLPVFWDQYDNAQRMDELGYGVRLPTYDVTGEQLESALEGLLDDTERRERMARMGARIRIRDGLRRGADVIESVGREARG